MCSQYTLFTHAYHHPFGIHNKLTLTLLFLVIFKTAHGNSWYGINEESVHSLALWSLQPSDKSSWSNTLSRLAFSCQISKGCNKTAHDLKKGITFPGQVRVKTGRQTIWTGRLIDMFWSFPLLKYTHSSVICHMAWTMWDHMLSWFLGTKKWRQF